MGILWIILIGFVAGMIARYLVPGPNNPSGFILTVVLGIAGSFLATLLGQAVGWDWPQPGATVICPRDVPRSGGRLVSPRPGRRVHRCDRRCRPRALYMASARRARRHL